MRSSFFRLLVALGFAGLLSATSVSARENLCDKATKQVAQKSGVPVEVLLALTRTETGRAKNGELKPWPWTVNLKGKGYWFSSKAEALAFATLHHDSGARSFDVGCFQVNFRWHGHRFGSISDMFDPKRNAEYAAQFLQDLKRDYTDWSDAAGAYHSKTPALKSRYQSRFQDILAKVQNAKPPESPAKTTRPNSFPLFQKSQQPGQLGSLFQGQSYARKPLFQSGARS